MKILEFIPEKQLRPTGGPVGYVHGLYEIDKLNGCKLSFLPSDNTNVEKNSNNRKSLKSKVREKLVYLKALLIGRRCNIIESNEFDIVHFHTAFELYYNRKSFTKYRGHVVFTSHSPTLSMKEVFANWSGVEKILFWPLYLFMKKIDYRAFELADYIIFPCKEAEEPYQHAWKGFQKFKEKNISKFRYLLTGTFPRKIVAQTSEIRKKYAISPEAFLISYVGRHEPIKGYDLLLEIGKYFIKSCNDISFIVAGKEQPLKGLDSNRWVEVGWTSDPHSIIGASDIFILPNRETYFDLVLLEVLSLGKIVVVSKTGGNRFFDKLEFPGIFVYSTIEEAIEKILYIKNLSLDKRIELQESNRKVFDTYFDNRIFYKNYLNVLSSIVNE